MRTTEAREDLDMGLTVDSRARTDRAGDVQHVLLAEDDAELRSLLTDALRKDGCDVIEARDGAEAIGQLESALFGERWLGSMPPPRPPDVIVSDVRMPGFTGLEVLGAVRGAQLRTPVILITAFGAADTHAQAHQLGVTAVLDKPFDVDDLRRLVRSALAGGCSSIGGMQ
jgi:two-component system response regulator (stage 0 sporulation protein F)